MAADTEDDQTPANPPANTNRRGAHVADTSVKVGQAVQFTFTDELYGTTVQQAGVVLAVDDELVTVAPVAPLSLQVPAGDVGPLPEPAEAGA